MSRPDPLTPTGCDLNSHTYFPLHYDRLLRSRWWRRASDLARSRNMDLWAHAFREVPAASLPDDDADLADMAGFGRDIAAFIKVKAEILEPWVLCSDGRYYHPTLAEVAGELWERMDGKRRANRERQSARRERIKTASVTQKSDLVTRDNGGVSRVTDPDVTLQMADVTRISGPKERKGDLGSNEPVASAPPPATDLVPVSSGFEAFWATATQQMRKRAKSRAKARIAWDKALKLASAERILAGLMAYLAGDPDVQRTGGPGLHIWLNDRTWEDWGEMTVIDASAWTDERWGMAVEIWRSNAAWAQELGPEPGQPGCRVPAHLLVQPAPMGAAAR